MLAKELITKAKTERKLTQTELAKKLGISQGRISHINTGREPMPEWIAYELAKLLEMDETRILARLRAEYAETKEVRDTWLKLVSGTAATIIMIPMIAIHDCAQCIFIKVKLRHSFSL